jgi:O-antigen/teichoic acid export membrane protein
MRLRALTDILRADLNARTERGKLVRSAGATAALKVGATLLAFGASLLYARALGPHGYGLYAYVMAWVAVLTIPAGLGLPHYLVREGAKFPNSVRWMCRWADRRILASGAAAGILMALAVFLPQAAGARWLFVIAAPLPLLNSLTSIRMGLLRARGWVARSQWPKLILGPLIALAALAVLWAWQGTLHPVELIAAMTGAALLPLLGSEFQLNKAARDCDPTQAHVRVRAGLPFMWLGGLYLINSRTDLIMLGALNGAHDAGIYAISMRAATLVVFFMAASNMAVAPRIAKLHHEGERVLLQRLLTASTRRILALSLPVALLFIVAGRLLLTYLYGADYAQGTTVLQILAAAQIVNVAAGPTGLVLSMTGHERLSATGVGASAVLNVALNAALIPFYGATGAAVATGSSLIARNILQWHWIRSRLFLRPTALGI